MRQNPDAYIIVTGCFAQLQYEELKKIKGIDLILGNNEKFNVLEYLDDLTKQEISKVFVNDISKMHNVYGAFTNHTSDRTRAFLKIQDGCDYQCTYCTIPKARGTSRSLSYETIIEQLKLLIDIGYKEIVLSGVNVGDFGRKNSTNLLALLKKLIQTDGEYRIRISSIEPNLLTDEIIQLTKSNDKLCKHFHIPLQSGTNKILKLMKRCYKAEFYRDLIFKIKSEIPDCGIGVDVISGFPEETDTDFEETYNFIHNLPISYLHAFPFSMRPGTKATQMSNYVKNEIKKKRTNELRILSNQKRNSFYSQFLNKEIKVLFETRENDIIKGFSSNYIKVASKSFIPENSFQIVKLDYIKDEIIYAKN